MNQGIGTIICPVKDTARARRLGSETRNWIGSQWPQGGVTGYYHVDDIQESHRLLLDAGAQSSERSPTSVEAG